MFNEGQNLVTSNSGERVFKKIRLVLPAKADPVLRNIADVFARQVHERCPAAVTVEVGGEPGPVQPNDLTVVCLLGINLETESFRIEDAQEGVLRITAGGVRGVLYGLGKILRTSRYDQEGFTPGNWRGVSAPKMPMRISYFATHFHNFYHDAPIGEVQRYVQDLGLWGHNTILIWFDMHHYHGINDPEAVKMLVRLRAILKSAKDIGLGTGILMIGNEGYLGSPVELRLTPSDKAGFVPGTDLGPGQSVPPANCSDGLFRGAFFGLELCPNKPGAMELLKKWETEELSAFKDVSPDYLVVWPWDTGGCTCKECTPWGANGYLKVSKQLSELARKTFPGIKIVLSTWLYDSFNKDIGEWTGLSKAFEKHPDWVDYIMADSYDVVFPEYPLKSGVPGGLPLLAFPEISMWGMYPWGGRGANPQPTRLQNKNMTASLGSHLSGGMPYSEGIYEDINKIIIARFYWDPLNTAAQTVHEYVSFEYSPDVADDLCRAIDLLEKNLQKPVAGTANEALKLLDAAAKRLSANVRNSWRWRILYARAVLDCELAVSPKQTTKAAKQAVAELINIYHAESAEELVKPKL